MAPGQTKVPIENVLAVLREERGLLFVAARRLGISAATIRGYAERFPEVAETIQEERGRLIDVAEGKLADAVQAGEGWAVRYALSTIGKDRGYVERVEHSGEVGLANLTDEQLRERARRLGIPPVDCSDLTG